LQKTDHRAVVKKPEGWASAPFAVLVNGSLEMLLFPDIENPSDLV
jgi:hypothetical protein